MLGLLVRSDSRRQKLNRHLVWLQSRPPESVKRLAGDCEWLVSLVFHPVVNGPRHEQQAVVHGVAEPQWPIPKWMGFLQLYFGVRAVVVTGKDFPDVQANPRLQRVH